MPLPDRIGYADLYEVAPTSAIDRSGVRPLNEWMEILNSVHAGYLSVQIGDTPPVSPFDGSFWWQSSTGRLFVRYNDGNSSQWVETVGRIAGDISAGLVTVPGGDTKTLADWMAVVTGSSDDFRPTQGPFYGGDIHRFTDRVFVGEAAAKFDGNSSTSDSGTSWMSDLVNYAGYMSVNAHLLVVSGGNQGNYGVISAIRTSDFSRSGICFGAHIVADAPGKNSWASIWEIQRESTDTLVYGTEHSAKNKGNNGIATPNFLALGLYGSNYVAGGDPAFGGTPTNPSTAAILISGNAHLAIANSTWNTGIIFRSGSLTSGEAISMSSQGFGGAHKINWYNTAGNPVFNVSSNATDTTQWTLRRSNTGIEVLAGANGILTAAGSSTTPNGFYLAAAAAGGRIQMLAAGTDTDIDISITPKGIGVIRYGTYVATPTAVIGYITIKDAGGTARKLAVIS